MCRGRIFNRCKGGNARFVEGIKCRVEEESSTNVRWLQMIIMTKLTNRMIRLVKNHGRCIVGGCVKCLGVCIRLGIG
jgi:hypothetical protein